MQLGQCVWVGELTRCVVFGRSEHLLRGKLALFSVEWKVTLPICLNSGPFYLLLPTLGISLLAHSQCLVGLALLLSICLSDTYKSVGLL
jgi:hypothetical protein